MDAWRKREVASALFLDVKGAFPSVAMDVLAHDLRKKGVPQGHVEWGVTILAFVDNIGLVATGKDFRTTHRKLKDVMERPDGVLDWAKDHNCTFGIEKFQLVDATRRKILNPLGLIINQELQWKKQSTMVIAKTAEWLSKFNRIAKQKGVAMPRILYGIEVFHPPKRVGQGVKFSALERRLESMVGRAAVMVAGGMSTSPRDVAMVHAGMQRITHAIQNANFKAGLRLTTLPASNPLQKVAASAANRYVKRFPTLLHHIMNTFDLNTSDIETIHPMMRAQWDPVKVQCEVGERREEAVEEEKRRERGDGWRVYTDSSAIRGRVGDAAVIYKGREEVEVRRRYLGKIRRHTVYQAEVIGVDLALEALVHRRCTGNITIGLDNHAVLAAIRHRWIRSAQHIWKNIQRNIKKLLTMSRGTRITFVWTPGHEGIEGNERADKCAKEATMVRLEGKLLTSKAATYQEYKELAKTERRQLWESLPEGKNRDVEGAREEGKEQGGDGNATLD
ncbi:hypothetical protein BJ165DRAFT_1410220 [Panaeolus papilionaceus]|nr:hypothetical protein BJ165DRAFT_1410220 [Panaeolus papilionaceus]